MVLGARSGKTERAPAGQAAAARVDPGLSLGYRIGGDDAPELLELARLLGALRNAPRVAGAAAALGVSYRTAWGRIVEAEHRLGFQLVERVKGHGSRLTEAGVALAEAVGQFESLARQQLMGPAQALRARLDELAGTGAAPRVRIAASHDLLLQRCVAGRGPQGVQVAFVGSSQALEALQEGLVELAGFHAPGAENDRVRAMLPGGAPAHTLALMRREQGLIVAAGNPMRVRDVSDLARPGLRFVNRQRGAGTRTWLDRLLDERGVKPDQISGYELEEASHLAVAAAVAAGEADAGFGLRAAALRFGLGFVPIGVETYWLAGEACWFQDTRIRALVAAVREMSGKVEGYSPSSIRRSASRKVVAPVASGGAR